MDVTAADVLAELDASLDREGVDLCFAELKDPVKDKLKQFGLLVHFGNELFFPTIEAAVHRFRETPAADRPNPTRQADR